MTFKRGGPQFISMNTKTSLQISIITRNFGKLKTVTSHIYHALHKVTTDGVPVATAGSQQQPFRGFGKRREPLKYICYHCRSTEHYGGNIAPVFNAANHSSGQ